MKRCSTSLVIACICAKLLQSCPTLFDLMNYNLPGPYVQGVLHAGRQVGCHAYFQGIFLSQGWNPHLLHWQTGSLPLALPRKPPFVFQLSQFSSVTQSRLTLCDPMNGSMPGLPVHHQLPGSTKTHVHWVSDAIQPSHPLSSHSTPALKSFQASGSFPMSQLFASGGQSIRVSASTSVLTMNTQNWSLLGWTGWISLQSKGLSRVFSNTTFQKYQFFGTQLSL